MAIQAVNSDDTARERQLAHAHFFNHSGYDILYFGGVTAVECFQPSISVGPRLRAITPGLGQTWRTVSTGRQVELGRGQDLIYLRVPGLFLLTREKVYIGRNPKVVESLPRHCSPRLIISTVARVPRC